jgi:hypothetical protein
MTARTINPAKPDKYDGQPGQAKHWVFEMEQYFTATGLEDPKRVPFAAAMLTRNASVWWESVHSERPITTWDEFKKEMLFNFMHIDHRKVARRKLRNLPLPAHLSRSLLHRVHPRLPGDLAASRTTRRWTGS